MSANEGLCDDDRAHRQRQARALGDPTRFAIFCEVLDAAAPLRVDTLAEHFGLNHNAIRQHLAKLVEAGLVEGAVMPRQGPGRPALHYRPRPEAVAAWARRNPYQQLSLLLLEMAESRLAPLDVGVAAGRRVAGIRDADDPLARLTEEMARRGFRPRIAREDVNVALIMQLCPFEEAALASPEVVCTLHRGLAEGMLEGSGYEVEDLVVRHPEAGACRLQVRPADQ